MKCNEKGWKYNEEKYYLENEKYKKLKLLQIFKTSWRARRCPWKKKCGKKLKPFSPAVWPAIGNTYIYTNVLIYNIDISYVVWLFYLDDVEDKQDLPPLTVRYTRTKEQIFTVKSFQKCLCTFLFMIGFWTPSNIERKLRFGTIIP